MQFGTIKTVWNQTHNVILNCLLGKDQVLHQVPWKKSQQIDEKQWTNKKKEFLKLMNLS